MDRNSKRTYSNQTSSIIPHLDDIATEKTLQQVKKAIESININVGDITLGDVSVASNDTTTHDKLDTLNTTLTNKHLNIGTDSVDTSGSVVNIGQCYATIPISGSVSVSNQISGYATSALQTTGNGLLTDIKNKHLDKTVDSVDISGQSVSVSNFPAVQEVMVNNLPSTQEVSGAVSVSNFPSIQTVNGSVSVSNQISGYATSALQTTGNGLLTDIKNKHLDKTVDSVDISGQSVSISNLPITQDVSGTVAVSNLPSVQAVSGSVSISNQISGYSTSALQTTANTLLTDIKTKVIDSNTDSITVWAGGENGLNIRALSGTTDNVDVGLSTYSYQNREPPFPASRDVLGVQLCGVDDLAGSNLINLVSNANGSLNTHITNAVDVGNFPTSFEISNFPATQPISGSVSISNLPSIQPVSGTFWQETQPVSGSVSVSNFPATQPVSGSVSVSNFPATQPVSGTFWQETQPVSGSVSVSNFPATQPVSGSVSVSNMSGYALDSSLTTTNDKLTTTNSTLSTMSSALTTIHNDLDPLTFDGYSNLNVNVANSSVPVSGTVNSHTYSSSGASIGATSSSLHTYDYNVNLAFDTSGNAIKSLAVAKNGTNYVNLTCGATGDLNTNITNSATTNAYSASGLNVYPILPKMKCYTIGGYDANATASGLISGNSTAGIAITTYNFGYSNPRTFYAVLAVATTRTLYYDYVDVNGNLIENASVSVNNSTATSLGSMLGIVDFRLSVGLSASNEFLYIGLSSTVATLKSTSLYYEDINQKLVSMFTIPNGYIGYITNLSSLTNTSSGLQLNRWTADNSGIRSSIWRINNTGNVIVSSGNNGVLGEILKAGESVAFSSQSAVAGKSVVASITLVATS